MQNIYQEVLSLDKICYDNYALNEDVLMENASLGITRYIQKYIKKHINQHISLKPEILIICGGGNNGADGITVARQLASKYLDIKLFNIIKPKSKMAILQLKRAELVGRENIKFINSIEEIKNPFIIIDAIFGSGLKRNLERGILDLIDKINQIKSHKIACDIPTGIKENGTLCKSVFKADITVTMGALKIQLFNDNVKDFVGKIKIATLGISNDIYQLPTNMFLLEKSDLKLPFRDINNSHKGSFGHLLVVSGMKSGASILASLGATNFGVGLVTLLSKIEIKLDSILMQCDIDNIPTNITSIAIGMGLSNNYTKDILHKILDLKCPKVIDADLFYNDIILDYLDEEIILTPHPKEFVSLLKMADIFDIDVDELQKYRIKYVKAFCKKYPKVVLLLKGANTIIAQNEFFYINTLGTQALSKGGSGDVLAGMIGSLLAQKSYHNFTLLDCAINACLAHSLGSKKYLKHSHNYSMTAYDLIDSIK